MGMLPIPRNDNKVSQGHIRVSLGTYKRQRKGQNTVSFGSEVSAPEGGVNVVR